MCDLAASLFAAKIGKFIKISLENGSPGIGQALDGTVHKTGVTQIIQPCSS